MSGDVLSFIDAKQKHQLGVAVPLHLRQQILDEYHFGLTGGHFFGKIRTYDALYRTWWWEGMYVEVQSYV